jgi:hypothetical protein
LLDVVWLDTSPMKGGPQNPMKRRPGIVAMIVAQVAAALCLLSAAALAQGTTEPQTVRLDPVVIGNGMIRLAFTQLQRGGLVVFKVRNSSSHPVRFLIKPVTIGFGPAQGAYGFKTKLLKPGQLASFQVEFQLRGVFKYASIDRKGKTQVNGKFVVT